jgi:hypothetical protein
MSMASSTRFTTLLLKHNTTQKHTDAKKYRYERTNMQKISKMIFLKYARKKGRKNGPGFCEMHDGA